MNNLGKHPCLKNLTFTTNYLQNKSQTKKLVPFIWSVKQATIYKILSSIYLS